jgi:uncharacterized protein (DUF1501 family)
MGHVMKDTATCCSGFSRAEVLRRGAASAGRGLPDIEPGMPMPAGTGLSRRNFLARSLGLALAVYGADALGPKVFESGIAEAAAGAEQPVLLSVFLPGGADSLTMLAPTQDSTYRALRSTLAVAPGSGTPFSEDPSLSWNASLGGLSTLHDEGKLSVMPAIGYSGANQSHFTSRHFWEIGSTDPMVRKGWMGRYLDAYGVKDNPLQGLALSSTLSPSLAPGSVPVAAVSYPYNYTLKVNGVEDPVKRPMFDAIARLGAAAGGNTARDQARGSLAASSKLREQLVPLQSGITSPVAYPSATDFNRRLGSLAQMIDSGLPLRCVTLDAPGAWDTHANQAAALPKYLKDVSDSLLAFQRDLEARGVADRVVTLIWSEFGRRVRQNGTGTDHGAAGIGMLMGTRVSGTMIGEFPGVTTLDSLGNLRATSDFRSLYCSLLESWFGVDAAPIIPGASGFSRYELLKSAA